MGFPIKFDTVRSGWVIVYIEGLHMVQMVRKKAKISNQYNQAPHQTQDTIWESDKNTRKHTHEHFPSK